MDWTERYGALCAKMKRWVPGRAALGALVLMPVLSATALGQSWLASDDANQQNLGPAAAKGALIWSHGRSINSEDWKAPTPPYVAALREGGWDTFRFNRWRTGDTLPDSAAALVAYVHQLKADGYARVVLAGQSFGAFLSLMAADDTDEVDAVVATAPAAFGSFSDFYDTWRQNADALYPLLEAVRSRVMVFYFHGDDFDPGGRGSRSQEILEARHIGHVVIDQPPELVGHWAASTPRFVERFGRCILDFVDAKGDELGSRCDGAPVRVADRPPAPDHGGGAALVR
jgi:pimeloyl-ACP methyl ester carboxylesterase